ncbi:SsgA family sporulation/cell division regulator [Actinacidiphila paucisporea]|uniref:Streptomyces sporulation and cell division protein, SsgA n=1 Tax=Actinacidiphila paucisporea TaxID=310782 RepID=A0A1M7NPX1_9ACTN|nr:SsgA family sporulation/cell division regulator [Actinacidiphila paucisporea]SHN06088.1 Streptomyces sporulation and cell division protein, SsgA [Actinacidiphila paucisporea]
MGRGDQATVRVDTVAALDVSDAWVALVAVDLVYRSRDPLAVEMVLRAPGEEGISWTFAWEVLAQGQVEPTGEGDVRVRPSWGSTGIRCVEVALGPFPTVCVRLPEQDVVSFVNALRARVHGDLRQVAEALDCELAVIMADA